MKHSRHLASLFTIAGSVLTLGCAVEAIDDVPAARVHVIAGFDQPESVQYDPAQDVWFVSSMAGYGSGVDRIGYIARFSGANPERSDVFIQGGHRGVRLDAPKGLALAGDTLWVADIATLRAFDARTGASLAAVDLRPHGAVLLNAVAIAPGGTLYVTDSGIVMSDVGVLYTDSAKIFAVGPAGAVRVVARGPELGFPNGIAWDTANDRLLVASFHPFVGEVYALAPADGAMTRLVTGAGRFDGLQILDDGRVLVSSWADSSLHVIDGDERRRIIRDLWQPADFGVDRGRGIVAIPLALPGRVELWQLPRN